jgi:hypothetical protein
MGKPRFRVPVYFCRRIRFCKVTQPRDAASRRRACSEALWQLDSSLGWGCASQECFGLPELFENGVSPARRAHVMAGMYLKSKRKFPEVTCGNHLTFQSYEKIASVSIPQTGNVF